VFKPQNGGALMIHLDDLAEIAEELQSLGMDVTHEIVYGPRGYQEGLDVAKSSFLYGN